MSDISYCGDYLDCENVDCFRYPTDGEESFYWKTQAWQYFAGTKGCPKTEIKRTDDNYDNE